MKKRHAARVLFLFFWSLWLVLKKIHFGRKTGQGLIIVASVEIFRSATSEQFAYPMFITINRSSFHFWWKENKFGKVSKYFHDAKLDIINTCMFFRSYVQFICDVIYKLVCYTLWKCFYSFNSVSYRNSDSWIENKSKCYVTSIIYDLSKWSRFPENITSSLKHA